MFTEFETDRVTRCFGVFDMYVTGGKNAPVKKKKYRDKQEKGYNHTVLGREVKENQFQSQVIVFAKTKEKGIELLKFG